jgi:hypothetical protein
MAIQMSQNIARNFICLCCDYNTLNKHDYNKHLLTGKHKKQQLAIISNDLAINVVVKSQKKIYACKLCNKEYKDNTGLWRHKKKCNENNIISKCDDPPTIDSNLIVQLLKQNEEFKSMLLEQNNKILEICKNNIVNSHNKSL